MPGDSVVYLDIQREVDQIVRSVVESMFSGKDYNPTTVATWISQSNEKTINQLCELNKNFKYICKTIVIQKIEQEGGAQEAASVQMAAECWWNQTTDGHLVVQWEQNPNMTVIVSLFVCAL